MTDIATALSDLDNAEISITPDQIINEMTAQAQIDAQGAFSNRIKWLGTRKNSIQVNGHNYQCIQLAVGFRQELLVDGFGVRGWVHMPEGSGTWIVWPQTGGWAHSQANTSHEVRIIRSTVSIPMVWIPHNQDFNALPAQTSFWIQSMMWGEWERTPDGHPGNDRHIWYPLQYVEY